MKTKLFARIIFCTMLVSSSFLLSCSSSNNDKLKELPKKEKELETKLEKEEELEKEKELETKLEKKLDPGLAKEEQDQYDDYITPELASFIEKYNVPVHRGIHPPHIEGYMMSSDKCVAASEPGDSHLGKDDWDLYVKWSNQVNLKIDMRMLETERGKRRTLGDHSAKDSFICGEGDKFTILFRETVVAWDAMYPAELITFFSAEVKRDADDKIVGYTDINYIILMENNNGDTTHWIPNGSARLLISALGNVITPENFTELLEINQIEGAI